MKGFSILLMNIVMFFLMNPAATLIYRSLTESPSCSDSEMLLGGSFSRITCSAASKALGYVRFGYDGHRCTLYGTATSTAPTTGISERIFKREDQLELGTTNIALGKTTTASAYWTDPINLVGDLGVDGDEAKPSYYHSHPSVSGYPWWLVDLGGNYMVAEVHVLTDGSGTHREHFREIEVRVGETSVTDGDFTLWPLLEFFVGPPTIQGQYVKFSVNIDSALCGRFVSIKKISDIPPNYLVFSEVKVYSV